MQKMNSSLGITLTSIFCFLPPVVFAENDQIARNPEFLWEISKNHLKDPLAWPSIWKRSAQTANLESGSSASTALSTIEMETNSTSSFQKRIAVKYSDWTLNEEARTQRYLQKVQSLQPLTYQAPPSDDLKKTSPGNTLNGPGQGVIKYYLAQNLVLNTPFLFETDGVGEFFKHETRIKYSASNESEILQLYDEVTIFKGQNQGVKVGDLFRTYSVGERYRSFSSARNLGHLVETNGILKITRVGPKSSVGVLVQCFGTISADSRACPWTPAPEVSTTGYRSVTDGKQTAQVVIVTKDQQFPQPFSFAIVDQGTLKGYKVGDMVLFFNRSGGRLSEKVLGNGLVVQVQDQSSTILIKDLYPGIINPGDFTVIVQTTI